MYIIHFTAKEKETNRLLVGDSLKCEYAPTDEQAIQECKDVVDYFNSTLRLGEKAREFVKVDRVEICQQPADYSDLIDGDEADYDDY